MDTKTLLHADYLDIIFDNRNKTYGGYELRKHYNQRLGKAGAFVAIAVGVLVCFSLMMANHNGVTGAYTTPVAPTFIDLTPKPILPKVIHETPPPAAPQKLKTKFFTDPVIDPTNDVPDDKTMSPITTDAHPGLSTKNGDSTGLGTVSENGTGKVIVPIESKPDKPRIWVEQMPQFSGDLNAYIAGHIRYPDVARESNIEGTVIIKFVVNEDGSVSDATVIRGPGGGCNEEALRMVKSMPNWKPGKQNGISVKVYFTLPIKFVLD